jgi:hypothetical protein
MRAIICFNFSNILYTFMIDVESSWVLEHIFMLDQFVLLMLPII